MPRQKSLKRFTCEQCGREFSTTASHARFCSRGTPDSCKSLFENENRRQMDVDPQFWNRRSIVILHDPLGTLRPGALLDLDGYKHDLRDGHYADGTIIGKLQHRATIASAFIICDGDQKPYPVEAAREMYGRRSNE